MFSKRLKEIRELKGLSQIDFAKKLNVLPTTISKYERGEIKPTTDFLANLCNVFDANINWLLTGDGDIFIKSYGSSDTVAEPSSIYSNDPDIRTVIDLMTAMPEEKKKACVEFCKDKKLLYDLQQKELKKSAG